MSDEKGTRQDPSADERDAPQQIVESPSRLDSASATQAHTSSRPAQQHFDFLRLPRELRDIVYNFCLPPANVIMSAHRLATGPICALIAITALMPPSSVRHMRCSKSLGRSVAKHRTTPAERASSTFRRRLARYHTSPEAEAAKRLEQDERFQRLSVAFDCRYILDDESSRTVNFNLRDWFQATQPQLTAADWQDYLHGSNRSALRSGWETLTRQISAEYLKWLRWTYKTAGVAVNVSGSCRELWGTCANVWQSQTQHRMF